MVDMKHVLGIGIIVLSYIVTAPIVLASGGKTDNLTVTIINETSANVEWHIPYLGEDSAYLPVVHQILQENIADVEVGIEQLFLQDVRNIQIAVDNQTLVITFSLAGNYSDSFITGKFQDLPKLGEYAPVGVDVLTINIPDDKHLSNVNPGPNEMAGNELIYYDYNWIYPLEIYYSDQLTMTQIGEEWKLPIPKTISVEDLSAGEQGEIDSEGLYMRIRDFRTTKPTDETSGE